MNVSPEWMDVINGQGMTCVHWSQVGLTSASDREIFGWAKDHEYIVFTHDLDFGAILASTQTKAPSVIQIRSQRFFPDDVRHTRRLIGYLKQYAPLLTQGALLTIDDVKAKVRVLPLNFG